MGTTDNGSWARIQQGVKDAEKLMGQKQYNMSMIKSRQTLEFMVKCLGDKALIVEGDLADNIDQLFEGRWISPSTKEHYHRIRVIGNKAVHEGDDSAYDANEALHLLSQEVHSFANTSGARRPVSGRPPQRQAAPARQTSGAGSRQPSGSRAPSGSGASRSGNRSAQRPSSSNKSRRRAKKKSFDPYDLLKPALILVAVILIALLIRFLVPGKDKNKDASTAETSVEVTTEAVVPTEEPTTEAPTEAPKVYKTSPTLTKLNIRSAASTDASVIGSLAANTVVEYVGEYDAEWAIITFDGKEAYVSSKYLVAEEPAGGEETTAAE